MPKWDIDFIDVSELREFSNPRTEMAPEDYAPMRDKYDDFNSGDIDREPSAQEDDYWESDDDLD